MASQNLKTKNANNSKWHADKLEGIEEKLKVDVESGISSEEVSDRREQYGKNELAEKKDLGILGKFIKQFKNPLVIILLVSGILTLLLGYFFDPKIYLDSIVISIALLINVVMGVFQEERASRAFETLNKSQAHEATVIRGGEKKVIAAEELVVGDVVDLESGEYVPADIRILKEKDLEANEAVLTGEWASVAKTAEAVDENAEMSEQENMVWMGTSIASGEGRGVVVAVGESTRLGEIAEHLTGVEETETPIQQNMGELARFLAWVTVGLVVIIMGIGVIREQSLLEMVLVSIAIAVSVVPEGLPAAVTVVLAIGMEKILDHGGLVRNLTAAETLGSTTYILTDKTGTITEATMKVQSLVTSSKLGEEAQIKDNLDDTQVALLRGAILASDAFIEEDDSGERVVRGRPIEKAIVEVGLEHDLDQRELEEQGEYKRLDFQPFSSENRFAVSLNKTDGGNKLFISGAPEFILSQSSTLTTNEETRDLTGERRNTLLRDLEDKSAQGLRIIAVATKNAAAGTIPRESEDVVSDEVKTDLTFLGFVVFSDPIREDVPQAIATAKSAGAKVVMITGDNPNTALSIARQVGIAGKSTEPVTGSELEDMSDEDIYEAIRTRTVFARVLPTQKYRLAKALQDRGEVVAMTGDGVNDAPALRNANIGVAVGAGTEVAKEASDLVLLDNSFSIIVSAIEEGRRIIDNLKRIVTQLIATSFGEVFLITGALLLAAPLPILPAQILWINIIEGGALTFAFAFEPVKDAIMQRDPRSAQAKTLLSGKVKKLIMISGIATGVLVLVLYFLLKGVGMPIEEIRTVMMAALSLDAIFFAFSLKNFDKPVWQIEVFSNKVLIGSIVASIVLLAAAIFLPLLQNLLKTVSLSSLGALVLLLVAILDVIIIESAKYVVFRRHRQ